jgi:hypothetical protein
MPSMKSLLHLTTVFMLVSCMASCSFGFNRRWNTAAQQAATTNPTDLTGAWQGTWKSEPTGHAGTLRAIVTPITRSTAASYHFEYKATWKQVLSAVFHADHVALWKDGRCTLSGQKDLGRFGGVFKFTGSATPKEFHAKYESKMDYGDFEMKRPGA